MGHPQARWNRHVGVHQKNIKNIGYSPVKKTRFSNPQFKPNEIAYQLTTAKVTFMVVHSLVLAVALSAARLVGFPLDRIILLDHHQSNTSSSMINSVPELICVGRQKKTTRTFYERRLDQGEGMTKIALLCWSSGTTGNPKVFFCVVSTPLDSRMLTGFFF